MLKAFMLPVGDAAQGTAGHRFALWHAPRGALRSLVLYAHPFAEEMNKSRRMAALQARALAGQGHGVLQIDLLGCGDSAGDFGDATWAQWIDDLLHAARWLRQHGTVPLTLWGLRAGCLLQAEVAARRPEPCNFLFWQPATSGAAVLRQFLRQAAASAMLDGGGSGVVQSLQRQLASGQAVEVSGYRIHPALASGLEQARLVPPPVAGTLGSSGLVGDLDNLGRVGHADHARHVGHVAWLDVTSQAQDGATAGPTPATQAAAAPWQAVAASVSLQTAQGPPFWQTTEIETAPQLLTRTRAWLDHTTRPLQPAAEPA